eukprot:274663_1
MGAPLPLDAPPPLGAPPLMSLPGLPGLSNAAPLSNKTINLNFGTPVTLWLQHDDKPRFFSFHDEIIHNSESTINDQLYLNFVQESFIKSICKNQQFTLKEILSIKIYTDTNKFQSALRKAFRQSTSKEMRKTFYFWATALHQAAQYHAKPIQRKSRASNKPTVLFHGLNQVFVVDNKNPKYHGPVSTTSEESVATNFAEGAGLLVRIQSSFSNKFKFVTGISVSHISQYKNEQEILLMNQYLPIDNVTNFDNDINSNVDHLMHTLKTYKKIIVSKNNFFKLIGMPFRKEFVPIIANHIQLYAKTVIPSKSVLERLVDELGIAHWTPQCNLLSKKANITEFSVFNCFSVEIKSELLQNHDSQYTLREDSHETTNVQKQWQFNTSKLWIEDVNLNEKSYEILIKNEKIFQSERFLSLQIVTSNKFENCCNHFRNNLKLEHDTIVTYSRTTTLMLMHKIDVDAQNSTDYITNQIAGAKFIAISSNNEEQESQLSVQIVNTQGYYIYDGAMHNVHFIVPFVAYAVNVNVYVQLARGENFILLKSFKLKQSLEKNNVENRVQYILQLLKIYKYKIKNPETFYQQIGFGIKSKELSLMKKKRSLLKAESVLKPKCTVIHRLVEELHLNELKQLSKYLDDERQRDAQIARPVFNQSFDIQPRKLNNPRRQTAQAPIRNIEIFKLRAEQKDKLDNPDFIRKLRNDFTNFGSFTYDAMNRTLGIV